MFLSNMLELKETLSQTGRELVNDKEAFVVAGDDISGCDGGSPVLIHPPYQNESPSKNGSRLRERDAGSNAAFAIAAPISAQAVRP